ncbi:hypothetical protein HQ563_18960 [bacterium]|nr:hypothetical protein [bacterium]
MTEPPVTKRDLVVLVADGNMEHALREILQRHRSLRIRHIDFNVIPHVGKADPGCYGQSHSFLRFYERHFEHALVIFDLHGSGVEYQKGKEIAKAEEVEKEVADRLRQSGWGDRADAVVIVPELEAWVWGPSPQVDQTLGWRGQPVGLREWLRDKDLWPESHVKPPDPKAAMEATLRQLHQPRSSSIYAELAKKVGLRHCRDRSFCRLVQILRSWFPPSESPK